MLQYVSRCWARVKMIENGHCPYCPLLGKHSGKAASALRLQAFRLLLAEGGVWGPRAAVCYINGKDLEMKHLKLSSRLRFYRGLLPEMVRSHGFLLRLGPSALSLEQPNSLQGRECAHPHSHVCRQGLGVSPAEFASLLIEMLKAPLAYKRWCLFGILEYQNCHIEQMKLSLCLSCLSTAAIWLVPSI